MATLIDLLNGVRSGPVVFDTGTATLTLDVSVSENHQHEVTITHHPVESGIDITDHAQPQPVKLTVEGMVSNAPLNNTFKQSVFALPAAVVKDLQSLVTGAALPPTPDYANIAYTFMLDLKSNPKLTTVRTNLKTYKNLLLTQFNVTRDYKKGDCLYFTSTFEEVRVVNVEMTAIKAAKRVNKGKKDPQPTDKSTVQKSWAKQGADTKAGDKIMHLLHLR